MNKENHPLFHFHYLILFLPKHILFTCFCFAFPSAFTSIFLWHHNLFKNHEPWKVLLDMAESQWKCWEEKTTKETQISCRESIKPIEDGPNVLWLSGWSLQERSLHSDTVLVMLKMMADISQCQFHCFIYENQDPKWAVFGEKSCHQRFFSKQSQKQNSPNQWK